MAVIQLRGGKLLVCKIRLSLLFLAFCLSGCATAGDQRWALLGDNSEKAFYIDRQQSRRLENGNYRYPVKVCLYQEGRLHKDDLNRDTNQVMFIEMDCRNNQWRRVGNGAMDQNDKLLFRQLTDSSIFSPIEPQTIHSAAYDYLCRGEALLPQHNH